MDFLGSFIGGGTGGGSKEFGSSSAATNFGNNRGGGDSPAWLPLAIVGGFALALILALALVLKK